MLWSEQLCWKAGTRPFVRELEPSFSDGDKITPKSLGDRSQCQGSTCPPEGRISEWWTRSWRLSLNRYQQLSSHSAPHSGMKGSWVGSHSRERECFSRAEWGTRLHILPTPLPSWLGHPTNVLRWVIVLSLFYRWDSAAYLVSLSLPAFPNPANLALHPLWGCPDAA